MMTRDQQRAQHAYQCVGKVEENNRKDYKVQVNSFGANVLRSGLAAAVGFLERDKASLFLEHLAGANIPNLEGAGDKFPERVRELPLAEYMLATREALKMALWFRRAVQAQAWGEDKNG